MGTYWGGLGHGRDRQGYAWREPGHTGRIQNTLGGSETLEHTRGDTGTQQGHPGRARAIQDTLTVLGHGEVKHGGHGTHQGVKHTLGGLRHTGRDWDALETLIREKNCRRSPQISAPGWGAALPKARATGGGYGGEAPAPIRSVLGGWGASSSPLSSLPPRCPSLSLPFL